jgi:hypothetical protein
MRGGEFRKGHHDGSESSAQQNQTTSVSRAYVSLKEAKA